MICFLPLSESYVLQFLIDNKELSGGVKVLIADSAAFGALNEDCLHTTCSPGTVKKYLHSSRMF